ncbi:MAG: hypothetical protein K0R89_14 [Ramlibacter sp.]|jgi:hypothetical protein|nr:hypothetical protein [Ramlibacter sp.]
MSCSYCGEAGRATREHVVPAFLLAHQKSIGARPEGWNDAARKVVQGDAVIRDVCAECNNGTLSRLDEYGKTLLTSAGVLTSNFVRRRVEFSYDYDLLLRWVLKIVYNSARASHSADDLYRAYLPYILESDSRPASVALGVYLAAPVTRTEASQIPDFDLESLREPIRSTRSSFELLSASWTMATICSERSLLVRSCFM